MLTLFTDTDCDFTPESAAKYGYKLLSMPYTIGDRLYYPYEDPAEVNLHEFYDTLRGGVVPTTSAISEQRYIDSFEPEFAAGNDILYVHFSAAMTASFDVMHKALEPLLAKYPERRFEEIDSKGISALSYAIGVEVAKLAAEGKSLDEIMEWSRTEVDKWAVYFFSDDLKFFRRSGRVSGLAATMGGLIGLRPIIYVNQEGKMVSIGTEKGRNKAMSRLADYVEQLGDDVLGHKVYVVHADCKELAEATAQMLQERFGGKLDIEYLWVNPTIGSHCGPDSLGISFHAKHR